MLHIDDFDAYCFDLDGTIYIGSKLLPGVKDTIDLLRSHNKKILFITNTSTQTREECRQRLHHLGIQAELDEIMTASYLSAVYFLEQSPDSQVYVVGEKAISEEFNKFSLKMTDNPMDATHVLVGLDRSFTYEKLNLAMNAVRNGAKLIATNPDPFYPVPEGYISDTLAIAKAIEAASGQPICNVIGKPSSFYGYKVLEKLKINSNRCLIIGDRLETDIMLGKTNDCRTCLVLTGVSKKKDIEEAKIYPDYIAENLQSLFPNK
ncbi:MULTISPECIES: HAD-IIA family hydrolase [Bacillota]|uniref:Acid sugar phosphatase n=1 Tax=Symbiobacterium thermophilum TaxID=2734 RepID=A0A953ICN7_SYMTR|nr:HAD-IIA family hydrolase [Symbiobacterium thermophilum]MBY6277796.1 haloacid dehalogenase [Symbiobacterium thermophilum]GMO01718.1 HAD-IIA family hydrolase [Parageobacillus thermoglucosidasius]